MRYHLLFILLVVSLAACDKKEPEAVETTEAAVEEPETTAEAAPEPVVEELTPEQIEAREKPFGYFVEGADSVKVGRSHFTNDDEGTPRAGATADPDVIASLVAAFGSDSMSVDADSPRCRPTHYIAFFKGQDKLRSFKLWCEKSEDVGQLYLEDRQFVAADPKTAGKMINGILNGEYAEEK